MTRELYLLQRGSALLLAPMVLVHLAGIILAVQGGLSGEEILARLRGNLSFALFYGVFALTAALHAGIGVAVIIEETFSLSRRGVVIVATVFGLFVGALGLRAVGALV